MGAWEHLGALCAVESGWERRSLIFMIIHIKDKVSWADLEVMEGISWI